jgi:hypothetical protein
MNKNKGIIGMGLVVAIVLGIVVVGGGAYYLSTSSKKSAEEAKLVDEITNPKKEVLPLLTGEKETVVENNQKIIDKSSIKVISPNGGEIYKDSDKILIKWGGVIKEDRIAIYSKFNDGGWCFIKDVSSTNTSYTFNPYDYKCPGISKTISSGKYKITLIAYENSGLAPEPGTAFAGDFYKDNGSTIDSSDNYFTVIDSSISTNSPKTYTYKNHGFTIELPKGFVPNEKKDNSIYDISLPDNNFLFYIADASSYEKNVISKYEYVKNEKIGANNFKVYNEGHILVYYFRQGNVAYSFISDTLNYEYIKTFKFVGWN